MQISQFFMNGDIKGAIAYMREHEEFKDILPAYAAIFEDCEYRTYEIPAPVSYTHLDVYKRQLVDVVDGRRCAGRLRFHL